MDISGMVENNIITSMDDSRFDDIRPYNEAEFREAIQRIADSDVFPLLASFVYPEETIESIRERVRAFTTIRQFQHDTMVRVNEQVIKRSITEFTCAGLERLSPERQYLFVSSHRDIMMDASLLQYFLVINGFETTEITFGANLMMNPVVVDVGKSNKMFKVERPGGDIREFYRSSLHLSEYIRHTITEKHESVWIAQRNGRTKNGIDSTDQGIIKMFCMSEPHDKIKALSELNIVPVTVSYEWEPCDILKTLELYESQYKRYTKKPGEDLNSILTGILQFKGHVHFEICKPLTLNELLKLESLTNNEYHREVSRLIDQRIHAGYMMHPNNYIAHDILYGNSKFSSMYTEKEYNAFTKRLSQLDQYDTCDIERLRELFLGIYASPIDYK